MTPETKTTRDKLEFEMDSIRLAVEDIYDEIQEDLEGNPDFQKIARAFGEIQEAIRSGGYYSRLLQESTN